MTQDLKECLNTCVSGQMGWPVSPVQIGLTALADLRSGSFVGMHLLYKHRH